MRDLKKHFLRFAVENGELQGGGMPQTDGSGTDQVQPQPGGDDTGSDDDSDGGSEDEGDGDGDDDRDDDSHADTKKPDGALSALRKERAANKQLRQQLKAQEERFSKLEQQIASIQQADADRVKAAVAKQFNLPDSAKKFLSGSSREELEASAKEIADTFGLNRASERRTDLEKRAKNQMLSVADALELDG